MDPNHANSDDFYEFSAGNSEGKNTMEMLIEDKSVNVIIDSGANCNFLMLEEVFESIIGGNAILSFFFFFLQMYGILFFPLILLTFYLFVYLVFNFFPIYYTYICTYTILTSCTMFTLH